MYCTKCGRQNPDNAQFCAFCGNQLAPIPNPTSNQAPEQTQEQVPNPTAYQNQFYQQPINATPKKKSKLLTLALILSCISISFSIGLLFNNAFFAIIGLFIIIPAIVTSLIVLIKTLIQKKKNTDYPKKDFIKGLIPVCLSIGLTVLTLLIILITANSRTYKQAMKAYENKDYETAYNYFVELGDYKDSAEMANECNYQYAISLASDNEWSKACNIFKTLTDKGYKASKALYLYSTVYSNVEARRGLAENKLISQLKNPSSYQYLGSTFTYSITDRSISTLDLKLTITVKYSATNSFGGRVSDTYSADYSVVLSNTYGVSASKLNEIMECRSVTAVANKYQIWH